jgi:hypothetical protein
MSVAASLPVASATVRVLPGLDNLFPTAINASDVVVGFDSTDRKPWRWDPATGYLALPAAGIAIPYAINDNGVVAGTNNFHAAAWLPDGTARLFAQPADSAGGGFNCWATGINIYGATVGRCDVLVNAEYPAVFNWHAPATLVQPNNTLAVQPYNAISNDGWIGGSPPLNGLISYSSSAVLVSPAGQDIDLRDHAGKSGVSVSGINAVTNHGWAAGSDNENSTSPCAFSQAVAWLSAGSNPHAEFRLGTCGGASGITDDWYVVGTGTDSAETTNSQYAFVWFPGKGLQRLPGLGGAGEYSMAQGISAKHHVVGTIVSGGARHTVIWTVAPRS